MSDHKFLKEWKQYQTDMIKTVHPEWDDKDIDKYLDKVIDKNLKDPECALVNNYLHKSAKCFTLDLYDYIHKTKPIMAGGGVLFKNQHEAINPPSKFLDGSMTKRKGIKKKLKELKPGSYEYQTADRAQSTEKVVANSYYGASGNIHSPFYNLFTALATTATGQSLISTMMCSFESFYANNIKFYSTSDALAYIRNSLDKNLDYSIEIVDMPKISNEKLLEKFFSMYRSDIRDKELHDPNNVRILQLAISNLSEKEKQEVYYSSYLFEFLTIPSVKDIIKKIVCETKSFKDPNAVPPDIKDDLKYLWKVLLYWIVYNHPVYNRINRLKFEKRKVVVTIDTDSNMLNIDKWMKFVENNIDLSDAKTQDDNEQMYIRCNSLCYILTKYTQVILKTYCKNAHIPDDFAPRLNMKNEYLYKRMVLTENKKSYTGIIRLREGRELLPEKLDTKGIAYMKSTATKVTSDFCKKLVKEDILYAKHISGTEILKKIKNFARFIEKDIAEGNKTFLNPLSVKNPEAYDKPFSNQGVRGTYIWNKVYPEMTISLPDKVTIAKVKMEKLANIEDLKIKEPKIYKILVDTVYSNDTCVFKDKGINVIAIPATVDKVPLWITEYIDKDKIISDNISKIYPILTSLGISTLDTRSNQPHFTNIISF